MNGSIFMIFLKKMGLFALINLNSHLGWLDIKVFDLFCLRFLKPDIYYRLAEKVAMKKSDRDNYIKDTVGDIQDKLITYSPILSFYCTNFLHVE